jgi:hypothetical protein
MHLPQRTHVAVFLAVAAASVSVGSAAADPVDLDAGVVLQSAGLAAFQLSNLGEFEVSSATGQWTGSVFSGAGRIAVDGVQLLVPDSQADLVQFDGVGATLRTVAIPTANGVEAVIELRTLGNDVVDLRELVSLRNPTTADITVSVQYRTDLVDDGNPPDGLRVADTSDGDELVGAADRWSLTQEQRDNVEDNPALIGTVVAGPGDIAVTPVFGLSTEDSEPLTLDDLTATFQVTVTAGQTRQLLFFHRMSSNQQSLSDLLNLMDDFDVVPTATSPLFVGIDPATFPTIVNWFPAAQAPGPAPAPVAAPVPAAPSFTG